MKHPALRIALAVATLALGCWAALAQAQPRSLTGIRQNIETSLRLQGQAIETLGDPDGALRLTWDAYVHLRAAHGDMTINASAAKFPDPVFPLTNERVEQARLHILAARDALRDRARWSGTGNPIDVARDQLTEAIHLTRIILATTF